MKPRKPYMIENGDLLATIGKASFANGLRLIKWHNWNGDQFATRSEAQQIIDDNELAGSRVIEVLDVIHTRIRH